MHGVLNSDNISIMGLTIDYGPYAFMDVYDANHICSKFSSRILQELRLETTLIPLGCTHIAINRLGYSLIWINSSRLFPR